ncbi:MAG: hypothetical protein U0791_03945 [Gemmataceae bacterium]
MSSPAGDAAPRTILQWVSTSNPLYVVSAGLFLFGLRISFDDPDNDADNWALASGLAFYTLLLAAAAVLLVRFAGIWNDVRTVLLLVVLMFLATSVTFDELLMMSLTRGLALNLCGLGFAIAISEGILRAIRLKLPLGFKLPYMLMLSLFFLYPAWLASLARDPRSEAIQWSLFAFPSVAGVVFLTLLPAIRRGPEYVSGNGSPWPWPFYPWSLFVFLAIAVVGRSFLICKSFHLLDGQRITDTIFAPFFLVPFGFALAALVLELGLMAKHRGTQWIALGLPAAFVLLAGLVNRDGPAEEFLSLFMRRAHASPMFLTLAGGCGFMSYAWLRGVPLATEALSAGLAAFACVTPDTMSVADAGVVRPEWLVAPVALQGVLGLIRRDAWRLIAIGGVAAAWLTGALWRLYLILRAEVAGLDYLLASLLLLPAAMFLSLAKSGAVGRWLERQR